MATAFATQDVDMLCSNFNVDDPDTTAQFKEVRRATTFPGEIDYLIFGEQTSVCATSAQISSVAGRIQAATGLIQIYLMLRH
jgi:hypothetical protein